VYLGEEYPESHQGVKAFQLARTSHEARPDRREYRWNHSLLSATPCRQSRHKRAAEARQPQVRTTHRKRQNRSTVSFSLHPRSSSSPLWGWGPDCVPDHGNDEHDALDGEGGKNYAQPCRRKSVVRDTRGHADRKNDRSDKCKHPYAHEGKVCPVDALPLVSHAVHRALLLWWDYALPPSITRSLGRPRGFNTTAVWTVGRSDLANQFVASNLRSSISSFVGSVALTPRSLTGLAIEPKHQAEIA
jgi:hypothetical protein